MNEYTTALLILSILGGVWGIIGGTSKVIKPLIEAITTLNLTVKQLNEDLKELKSGNTDDHRRFWQHAEEQDKQLVDHDKRLTLLEKEGG